MFYKTKYYICFIKQNPKQIHIMFTYVYNKDRAVILGCPVLNYPTLRQLKNNKKLRKAVQKLNDHIVKEFTNPTSYFGIIAPTQTEIYPCSKALVEQLNKSKKNNITVKPEVDFKSEFNRDSNNKPFGFHAVIVSITNKNISKETTKHYKESGGFDLCGIEGFEAGVQIAIKLKNDCKGILSSADILKGYNWAVQKLWKEE